MVARLGVTRVIAHWNACVRTAWSNKAGSHHRGYSLRRTSVINEELCTAVSRSDTCHSVFWDYTHGRGAYLSAAPRSPSPSMPIFPRACLQPWQLLGILEPPVAFPSGEWPFSAPLALAFAFPTFVLIACRLSLLFPLFCPFASHHIKIVFYYHSSGVSGGGNYTLWMYLLNSRSVHVLVFLRPGRTLCKSCQVPFHLLCFLS